jgi:glycosyltransferase involved in cell wall biosynthesis
MGTEPGLPGQRNAGLERATADTILFLDDDVELESGFLPELLSVYDDPEVGGATGLITNQVKPAWWVRVLQRFFLLSRFGKCCWSTSALFPALAVREVLLPPKVRVADFLV